MSLNLTQVKAYHCPQTTHLPSRNVISSRDTDSHFTSFSTSPFCYPDLQFHRRSGSYWFATLILPLCIHTLSCTAHLSNSYLNELSCFYQRPIPKVKVKSTCLTQAQAFLPYQHYSLNLSFNWIFLTSIQNSLVFLI